MDIKQRLREMLLESSDHKHEYGCLMVFLDISKKVWDEIQNLIDKDDLYVDPDDDSFGRENNPHVTILYGLHGSIKDKDIEEDIKSIKEPKIAFKNVSSFDSKDYDVLKFDVKSSDLVKLNKIFSEYPHTSSFPDYHPHCTIAYLKKGLAKKYADKLKDKVDIEFEPSHIIYSKIDGSENKYDFK